LDDILVTQTVSYDPSADHWNARDVALTTAGFQWISVKKTSNLKQSVKSDIQLKQQKSAAHRHNVNLLLSNSFFVLKEKKLWRYGTVLGDIWHIFTAQAQKLLCRSFLSKT